MCLRHWLPAAHWYQRSTHRQGRRLSRVLAEPSAWPLLHRAAMRSTYGSTASRWPRAPACRGISGWSDGAAPAVIDKESRDGRERAGGAAGSALYDGRAPARPAYLAGPGGATG